VTDLDARLARAPTVPLAVVPPRRPALGRWVRAALGVLLMAVLVVGGTAVRVWQVARVDDRRPVDMVVVLGAAQYAGSPSSIFAARLRHAQDLLARGVAARVVTVGGRRAGDGYTEAAAGRRYLIGRGVPPNRVLAVGRGSDTLGSLRAAAALAGRRGWSSALLVSDPWHSLRARTMARDAGLAAWTSPTHSGPVVRSRQTQLRYIVRETGALLFYRLTHASAETESTGLG
jgi:uncharacterized SAM-binding protein YcdF (DUF218 family)